MRQIAILGSTGSIGCQALQVAAHLGQEAFRVVALAARANIDLLEQQIRAFCPKIAVVFEEEKAAELKKRLGHFACQILSGIKGLCEAACHEEVDFVVMGMTGTEGLLPVLKAIESGKTIGLANKEILVTGGPCVVEQLNKNPQSQLIPIDSEHSALFQCLQGEEKSAVHRLILTASGGPFYRKSQQELETVSIQEALRHPNWKMGQKVTVDSSTLMNKGLEVIEAHYLFQIPLNQIEVVVHPQSIIHSMIEFNDSSMKAQLGLPNMQLPIQYAMTFPNRFPSLLQPFDFTKTWQLEFSPPDLDKFPCLKLAFEAASIGGTATPYLNAANEVLVDRFLHGEISWRGIGDILKKLMDRFTAIQKPSLEAVLEVDKQARKEALNIK